VAVGESGGVSVVITAPVEVGVPVAVDAVLAGVDVGVGVVVPAGAGDDANVPVAAGVGDCA
jgi:hypothetical protein